MNKFIFACLAGTFVAAEQEFTYRYNGMRYQSWSAAAKHGRLMQELFEEEETVEYNYELSTLFELDMQQTTCAPMDEITDRPKMLHQKGVVASVIWESTGDHPYTGLFEGADWGIARLSDSGFIVDDHNESNPSIALKFMVDNDESENLLFMIDWNNQQTLDFFPKNSDGTFKPFTTHPQPFHEDDLCNRKTIVRKMKEGSFLPFSTGTGHFASVYQYGDYVEEEKFPFELQLVPNEQLVHQFDTVDALDYLSEIQANTRVPFFKAYAREQPESELQEIGGVYFTTDLRRSTFGDSRLFFRHEPFNRDVNRLRDMGFRDEQKHWRRYERANIGYSLGNDWDDTEIPDMGEDAMETVEGGILDKSGKLTGCPFQWLLE